MNHKRAKGQIQLGESVAVIIIVIILLFVGIIFWNNISSANINEMQTQSNELSVIEIANIISELPELKCSEAGVYEVKCLDLYKIESMNRTVNNISDSRNRELVEFYHNYFRNAKITIVQVYPDERNITIYDVKIGNTTASKLISIPVNIKDYVHTETSYGFIEVIGYYTEK